MSSQEKCKSIFVSELMNKTSKCRYCHKEVLFRVLPIHEYNCSQEQPNEPSAKDRDSSDEPHALYK